MSPSLARLAARRTCPLLHPSLLLPPSHRPTLLRTETRPLQVRNARHEPHNDRGWYCFLEKERGRNLLRRRRPSRNRARHPSLPRVPSHISHRRPTRHPLTSKLRTMASSLKSLYAHPPIPPRSLFMSSPDTRWLQKYRRWHPNSYPCRGRRRSRSCRSNGRRGRLCSHRVGPAATSRACISRPVIPAPSFSASAPGHQA